VEEAAMGSTERPFEPGDRLKRMGGTRFVVLVAALFALIIGFAMSQLVSGPSETSGGADDAFGNDPWPN
jgi:hypothetical protein